MSFSMLIDALPPTVNHVYPTGKHGKRFKSKAGKDFSWLVMFAARQRAVTAERVKITLTFTFDNKRKQDISNRIKVVEDALVECGIIPDDSNVWDLHVMKAYGEKPQTFIVVESLEHDLAAE